MLKKKTVSVSRLKIDIFCTKLVEYFLIKVKISTCFGTWSTVWREASFMLPTVIMHGYCLLCVCVCVYVCVCIMYVYMCVCVCMQCTYVCMYVCMYVMYVCIVCVCML